MASKNSTNSNQAAIDPGTGASVDQIREIIFGSQMREYSDRFSELEKRLVKELERLKAQMEERLDRIEQSIIDERSERHHDVEQLAADLSSGGKSLGDEIAATAQRLGDELEAARNDFTARLESQGADLSDRKADRAALSKLLAGVAQKLADEPSSPAKSAKRKR